jgi:hypothetical protein
MLTSVRKCSHDLPHSLRELTRGKEKQDKSVIHMEQSVEPEAMT